MNLLELKQHIDRLVELSQKRHTSPENISVGVKIFRLGSVGPTSTVGVKSITLGFDWDKDKLIIIAEKELREIDRDEIASLLDRFDEMGWTQYEVDSLKRENARLNKLLSSKEN